MKARNHLTSDGVQLAYYVFGPEDGPPLVLSNGLGGNIYAWESLIDYFSATYRVLSWDYRGLYNSGPAGERAAYDIPFHKRDLVELLELENVRRPVLVGWSMGVQVNFEYCRAHSDNVSALVAVNGTSGRPFRTALGTDRLEHHIPSFIDVIKEHWEKATFLGPQLVESRLFFKAVQTLGLVGSTAEFDAFYKVARDYVQLDFGIYLEILGWLGSHDASDVLPGLDVPTLIVAGERDAITPASVSREMAAAIPDAELCVLAAGTHYCPIEFPELVNLRIEKFLLERAR